MGLDVIESVLQMLAAIIGLLLTLFKYIETPKRGWMYVSVFFLTHLLSDYYWTIYTLVMGGNPDVSAFMAYLGWNIGYVILLILALHMRPEGSRRYFHPLVLLPIPLNIWQFMIYLPFGGVVNNIWEGGFATAAMCVCMQAILYYLKNRKEGAAFPWMHTILLLFLASEYAMWTSSCYFWDDKLSNPYYWFSFVGCILLVLFGWAVKKDYEARGYVSPEMDAQEMRSQIILEFAVFAILVFGCVGGYSMAKIMKQSLPPGEGSGSIAVMLFVISVVLVVLILTVIGVTAVLHKKNGDERRDAASEGRGRFNFYITVFITLALMIASGIYTSRLFYQVSVTGVLEDGETVAESSASDLENYLGSAKSILWVTADTVELMLKDDQSDDLIEKYIVDQTTNQKEQFDENFTGLYAYINGKYMDGVGWKPPKGYNAEKRDWYKAAVKADGKTIIVSPYVDMQTGSVVITICKLLDDGKPSGSMKKRDVVALDMVVNHVQETTADVTVGGKGYAMVLNQDGLIIAHRDTKLSGKNIKDIYGKDFMKSVIKTDSGSFQADLDGERSTLFVDRVIDQWYVVIPVGDDQLFEAIYHQLLVNVIVSTVIFLLISFFYYIGYKNEQLNSKRVEELKSAGIRNKYEARMLKVEKAAADEANRAKSQFLAQMSHEIRTPINAILGMNEMVLRESEDDDILDYSQNIQAAGRTLLSLINDILDFSKIEDGKMELVPVSYDLSSLINDLVISIRERARQKDLEFKLHVDESLPRKLSGDDVRIRQVIVNLLTNAVKYTETGTVELSINNAGIVGEDVTLAISVRDTGMGIKEEDMEKLFEAFERIDEKRNRNIEGTGLGMAIVTKLLKMMGSTLQVKSTYGVGSVFSFDLKQGIVSKEPIGDFEERIRNDAAEQKNNLYLKVTGAKILVVDDNAMNRKVAASLMKKNGIAAELASSGEETIELAKRKRYDIIFLDHMMPKMDGIETLQKLKEEGLLPEETSVIALTANAIEGARGSYLEAGFDDYLSKPIEVRQLDLILDEYLPDKLTQWQIEGAKEPKAPEQPEEPEEPKAPEQPEEPEEPKAQEEPEEPEEPAGVQDRLASIGLDVKTGMGFCGEDEEFYLEILGDYADAFKEKSDGLSGFFEKEDWHNYEILVHSLKSTSKSIGADDFSEAARTLEFAAKDNDIELIRKDHASLLEDYEALVEKIRAAIA